MLIIKDHPHCSDYNFDNNETDIHFKMQVQGQFKRKPQRANLPWFGNSREKRIIKIVLGFFKNIFEFLNAAIVFMKSWGFKWVHLKVKVWVKQVYTNHKFLHRLFKHLIVLSSHPSRKSPLHWDVLSHMIITHLREGRIFNLIIKSVPIVLIQCHSITRMWILSSGD